MSEQQFCEVESTDPAQHARWLAKHGFKPEADGTFRVDSFEGQTPVSVEQLFDNIRANVQRSDYVPLYTEPFDERTFVMVCGGPSLADHLDEIRAKTQQPDKYLIVCSNMTGGYLLEHGITAHAHFCIDPQEKKRFDFLPHKVSRETQYWLNVACHPAVFAELRDQGIKPYAFLADFDPDGKAVQAVRESMQPGQPGMAAIQGGTMAGLRALNLADALGFRSMEYYGFDGSVRVADGRAQPYAYEKKRGEAIIEIQCDRCAEKFDTTLIFQKQVNEFLKWRQQMPWLDVRIIGGGLIAHYWEHVAQLQAQEVARREARRYTPEYAQLQRLLHAEGAYGVTGKNYIPTIFHGVAQLAKRLPNVSVLDYGAAQGDTMRAVRDHLWLPPNVTDHCYDPFVDDAAREPEPADFVICTDVMEHVEPECTWAVLDHIQALTKRIVFFSISLKKANKVLADGRNAHVNLRTSEFWLREIQRRFVMSEAKVSNDGEVVLAIGQALDDVRERTRFYAAQRASEHDAAERRRAA